MDQHLNDLQEIRKMMEKSSRFLSLSGLSGVAAGLIALLAGWVVFQHHLVLFGSGSYVKDGLSTPEKEQLYINFLVKTGLITLVAAITAILIFTWYKAKGTQQKLWVPITRKMLISLLIPLITGGLVILYMFQTNQLLYIPELTLIFYGLALVNASHYTYGDVFYLGICQIILGVVALFYNGHSLEFWMLGFGLLHIVYGISMHIKYERKK